MGVPGGYRNPPGSVCALLGLSGREEEAARWRRVPPKPKPNWTRFGPPLSFSPLLPSLLLLLGIGKRRGILLGLGSPSRIPHTWRAPLGTATSSLPSFIYVVRGHPIDTQVDLLVVCGAPSTVTHLGHIVVVLRRSPAPVTSSSPSPRHRADGTLPRPQLDQEFEGRPELNVCRSRRCRTFGTWIGLIMKTFDYINRVTKRFCFWCMRVCAHTLPSRCYASPR